MVFQNSTFHNTAANGSNESHTLPKRTALRWGCEEPRGQENFSILLFLHSSHSHWSGEHGPGKIYCVSKMVIFFFYDCWKCSYEFQLSSPYESICMFNNDRRFHFQTFTAAVSSAVCFGAGHRAIDNSQLATLDVHFRQSLDRRRKLIGMRPGTIFFICEWMGHEFCCK